MISLISRWKLRNGCPEELVVALNEAVKQVKKNEAGTLMYSVHTDGPPPLKTNKKPAKAKPATLNQQTEITFFEIYANEQAFSDHIQGPIFKKFVKQNIKHFYENPNKPGSPNTQTQFLDRIDAFIRTRAD